MNSEKEVVISRYYEYDQKIRSQGYSNLLGLDEAGRGAWAGPLVIAGCVLKPQYQNDLIKDSKQVKISDREKLYDEIIKNSLGYQIVFIEPTEVDELNPKKASIAGMEKIIEQIPCKVDYVLTDAEKVATKKPSRAVIKGDSKSLSIAAASILAKVARDRYMINIDQTYPGYDFARHKGYGTLAHLKKLRKIGPIIGFHRYSYKPIQKIVSDLKSLNFKK